MSRLFRIGVIQELSHPFKLSGENGILYIIKINNIRTVADGERELAEAKSGVDR